MASEQEMKAVEKLLTGCVNKVLDKFMRSSRASPDSEDEFQTIVKRPKTKPNAARKGVTPSAFLAAQKLKARNSHGGGKGKGKLISYDRDIVCLPKSYGKQSDLINIPKKRSTREFLAKNKLICKIQLNSAMREDDIFEEIRSSFRRPMRENDSFTFKILQPSGGDTRCLMVPEVSESYKWSAGAVAGRNAKVPIYILAEDDLKLEEDYCETSSERDDDDDHKTEEGKKKIKKKKIYTKEPAKHGTRSFAGPSKPAKHGTSSFAGVSAVYRKYVNLVSSEEDDEMSESPDTPPFSPFTPVDESSGTSAIILLKTQRFKNLPVDRNAYQRLVVRRKHIWRDSLQAFKSHLDFGKYIRITFVGEPAVDEGGPLREYLHLLMGTVASHNDLFRGDDYSRVPCPNVRALQQKTYKYIGQMIAVSLIHGGPVPNFLAPSVIEYITYGLEKVKGRVLDVPNGDMQEKLTKLKSATTVSEARDLVDYDFRYDIGLSTRPSSFSLSDRDQLVNSLAIHFTIVVVKAQLDQVIEGLNALGVYDLIKANPNTMFNLLHTIPVPLTATAMMELFEQPYFSEQGSIKRDREEQIMMYWVQLLHQLEDAEQPLELVNSSGEIERLHCKLETILAFITGAPRPPPCGFMPQPNIRYVEEQFPRANTCSNALYLPMPNLLPCYEQFCFKMVFGVLNAAGFQRI